jgi:hypothetical protein
MKMSKNYMANTDYDNYDDYSYEDYWYWEEMGERWRD